MNKEDAEEYTQSLGQIVGGSYRQILLAKKLGIPQALGLSAPQWVNERLGGYVRMAADERVEHAKELSGEGFKQRDIADALGVTQAQISRDLSDRIDTNVSIPSADHGHNEVPVDTNVSTNPSPVNVEQDESQFDLQGRDPQDFQAATQAVGAASQMLHTINARALAPDRVARGFLDDDARLEQFATDLAVLSKWIVRTRNLIEEENKHETRRRA